jgi:hypothetical protein
MNNLKINNNKIPEFVPIRSYINAKDCKFQIYKENNNKSGIYQ